MTRQSTKLKRSRPPFNLRKKTTPTICNIVYNQEGTPKMKRMLIFWEMRDSSKSFMPFLPKPSHHTIPKVYLLGTQLTLPKSMGNNTIFLFQKV